MQIDFPPGIANEASRRRNKVNWREANLIRWQDNTLKPVGGWVEANYETFASSVRAMHRWVANNSVSYVAYLCEEHCYVDPGDGVLIDITPIDGITPPPFVGAGGYGDDHYGTDEYGEPRNSPNRSDVATPSYTLDNWGEELRVMTSSDGRLLRWTPQEPSEPLSAVENAPINNRSFVVTPERHIILFGTDGVPQAFDWCDEEDDTEWTPGTTTKAGGYFIQPAAPIMARHPTQVGTLMFTANASYIIRYLGLPYIYNYDKISDSSPPISPAAIASTPEGAEWLAINGFWKFNGVSAERLPCPIWDLIKGRMNVVQTRFRAHSMHVRPFSEIWTFITVDAESTANNFVIIRNYRDDTWSMGEISRTCGVSSANDPNPLMSDGESVFVHESGFNYPGAEMPWIESHTINADGGFNLLTIIQMLPEVTGSTSAVQFKFLKRNNPSANGSETESSIKLIRDNGYVDVRETARDIRMRVEMVAAADWSLGPIDMNMKRRGQK